MYYQAAQNSVFSKIHTTNSKYLYDLILNHFIAALCLKSGRTNIAKYLKNILLVFATF